MDALRIIANYQLRKNLKSRSFLLSLLALPILVLFSIGLGLLVSELETEKVSLGIVDPAGWLVTLEIAGAEEPPGLVYFIDDATARTALDSDQIQAYYVLPFDYPSNAEVTLVYYEHPGWDAQEYFQDLLRINLLTGYPESYIERVIHEPQITVHATDNGRSFPSGGPTLGLLSPVLVSIIYIFSIFPVAELIGGTLGIEKANRTIEVLMTSIRTSDFIFGKLIAASILLFLGVVVWVCFIILMVWIGRLFTESNWFWDVKINWLDMIQMVILSLTGLVFYVSALVLIGSMFAQEEDVRQASSLVFLPLFLPLYVLPTIIEQPDSLVSQIFGLLPITSVQTLGFQILFSPLPVWKLLLALVLNLAGAGLCAWLAMRVVRIGMLRYGRRVRMSDLFISGSLRRGNRGT